MAIDILNSLPLHHGHATNTIVCGDFNARSTALTADTISSARGRLMEQWIRTVDITLWNNILAPGQPTFISHSGTSIIDWFLSTRPLMAPTMHIRSNLSLNTYCRISQIEAYFRIVKECFLL
ncbi:hypothetical protein [Absidia glauca]|uniref:Endonuclease/exonuclease/phosphatase domain-containing protein n=1 Tax=Absidia glauca TaxID=4829 RepID=A0A168LI15_ABSGL|nr:hypothetical protein [Absidia glauca]